MKKRRPFALLTLCLVTCALTLAANSVRSKPVSRQSYTITGAEVVSIIALIANPERFAGKKVQLEGYVSLKFETNVVFLHEEDYRKKLYSNGLAIDVDDTFLRENKGYSGKYLLIEGTFTPTEKGEYPPTSGHIGAITRFEPL